MIALKKYRSRFIFTLFLILLESGFALLFPLFIGFAIDDALNSDYAGAIALGCLGVAELIAEVSRRVYDSRLYAKIYEELGVNVVSNMDDDQHSMKSARLGMLRELVEFFENSLPELINTVIGLTGVLIIIATLNMNVFYLSLIVTVLIFFIYWATSKRTVRYNKAANDEYEKQVEVISMLDKKALKNHLSNMMKWNVKLSDLEAINVSISWVILMGFLIGSIIISIQGGIIKYGALFSLIMYVFQYMESVINLPFFYQNWLRLREIRDRLSAM